jgi:hypothetical protein
MAARVTPTGFLFGDGTTLTTKFGIIPQNSVTIFYQDSAPLRWKKSTTHNDKTLRVVSGEGDFNTGGLSGGTQPFTTIFPNSLKNISGTYPITTTTTAGTDKTGNHTLLTSEIASHSHGNGGTVQLNAVPSNTDPDGTITWNGGDVSRAAGWSRDSPGVANAGTGGSHNHPWSGSASFSQNIDLRVQYIDVISCKFDG